MKKILSILSVFLMLVTVQVHAIVDPMENTWVHDYADIISEEAEKEINERVDALNGGAQVVVVTVDFLDGMSAQDYAYKLFNEWGIGDKDKDNGVLLLVSMGEEQYYYLQGSGLEKTLPSSTLGSICDDYLVDDLGDGNYDRAFVNTVDEICDRVEKLYAADMNSGNQAAPTHGNSAEHSAGYVFGIIITVFVIVIILFVLVAIISAPRGYGRTRTTYVPFFMPRPRRYYRRPPMYGPGPGPGPAPRPREPHRSPSSFGGGSSFSSHSSSRPSGGHSSFGGGGRSFGGGSSRGGGGGGGFGKH